MLPTTMRSSSSSSLRCTPPARPWRWTNRIVLHEYNKYYPSTEETYPGVKTVTLDEDAQDLSEPIIKPIKQKNFSVLQKEAPELTHTVEFLESLME